MALLLMDGFDAGDASLKWISGNNTSSATGTRFNYGRSVGIQSGVFSRRFTASSQIFVGLAMHISSLDGQVRPYVSLSADSGATIHLTIGYSNAALILYRGSVGGTVLGTYSAVFSPGTWYHLEVSATVADAGGTCTVKLNGATVITYTGDTKNAGTSTNIDTLALGSNGGFTAYFDDVYVANSTGSAPYNTFLGDVRVYALSPSGAGTSTQFTPSSGANYTTVDELPYSATDYVSGTTIGLRDLYTMSDLPATANSVLAVQHNVVAKKADAYPISMRPVIRSGASNYFGNTVSLGASDSVLQDLRTEDPATTTAWTISGVNALEAGMETV